ncbi:MAG: T9SS type A sorting domain-containing protein [Paludibacteraceae bacterium]|nr:T9SS type A sorting domain-containing protein [Paludibacteraceae bacterium]
MRRVLIALAMAVCGVMAHADTYNYLVFTNTSGAMTTFGVNNLTLTVSGSNLQVSNNDGTVNLVLTELASMQFSTSADTITAIENVLEGDKTVRVFSLSGVLLGEYNSLLDAVQQLGAGAYVITNGSVTQKIVVK